MAVTIKSETITGVREDAGTGKKYVQYQSCVCQLVGTNEFKATDIFEVEVDTTVFNAFKSAADTAATTWLNNKYNP